MCGILGWIRKDKPIDKDLFRIMLHTLEHRGPDDQGEFYSENECRALGHTRLSFLDLSSKGKQPFYNKLNKCYITFNGEIYNYLELKKQLSAKYSFQTNTDTEVILAAYLKWGVEFVQRLKGMFAIAILDEKSNKLLLFRDRFGIKPLYYHLGDENVLFASELKAIMASKVVSKEINFSSFTNYFIYRYVPSPDTIWEHVAKIPPAHYAIVDLSSFKLTLVEYWQLKSGNKKANSSSLNSVVDYLLTNSVKEHIRSDVPVGSFLSGGYDSSALVLYMKKLKEAPQTFSIGFKNWKKSEHIFAGQVAKHLEVENEYLLADGNSLDLINKMPMVYDEPIADISIIPTFLVSKLARTKVKAVLSGEGADEVFGGYTWQHDLFNKSYPDALKDKIKLLFKPTDLVKFYSEAMSMGNFDTKELKAMLHPRLHKHIPKDVNWFYRKNLKKNWSPLKSVQHLDIKCFMGELVLTKIDRASMANSLEVRVPFLDHEIFETLFQFDEKISFDKKQTKPLLFECIKNDMPKEILERKKQGFVGPDDYYMNRDWYKNELQNSLLISKNIINKAYVEKLLSKDYDWRLWKIIVMEKWYQKWVG